MTDKAKSHLARRKWLRLIAAQGGIPAVRKTYSRGVIPGGVRKVQPTTTAEALTTGEGKEATDDTANR